MNSPRSDQARWFADEVHAHETSLKAYLRGAFPSMRDIDDVVQESYLRIWRAKMSRPIGATKSFLFQIARHLAIDFLRRERVSPLTRLPECALLPVLEQAPDAAAAACTNDELDLLAEAIHALPNRCRQVLILRQIEGASQKEIAAQLGLSEFTVQTHVVHGLRRIEEYFRRRGVEPPRP